MPVPLKVMVVDDTLTYRMVLQKVLSGMPDTEVCAMAVDGSDALEKLAQNPVDLVFLDLEMPRMDGMQALEAIRRQYPETGVVMISGINQGSAHATIRALEVGALDFIRKPDSGNMDENLAKLRKRLEPIVLLKQNSKGEAPARTRPIAPVRPATGRVALPYVDVIVVGVSTGGPKALMELLPQLPGDLGVPVLVVQHMPPMFTASLADSLDKKSRLTVVEARAGEPILPNRVYLAPGGWHMGVARGSDALKNRFQIELNQEPPENSCRPAVDVLFRSVGQSYGRHILAVVMTGMGSDGAKGLMDLKRAGSCYCLTQSADSCVVYGMPKAVDDLRLSDEQVPLADMAGRIVSLVKRTGDRL